LPREGAAVTITFQPVDVFTQQMNAAFIKGYDDVGETPDVERALTIIPSKGRVENLPWISPPPMPHLWQGARAYAQLSETNYRVANLTYTQEFKILNEDLDDDQVGGFKMKFAAMGRMAKEWKYIASMKNLALGQTVTAFDGRPFFSSRTDGTSGAIGTGNNIFTATTALSDATHCMVVLVTSGNMVKPMFWLDRQAPDMQNDMGTPESKKTRESKFWADSRGAAGFGAWSDAVLCKYIGTPTVAEVQTALGTANARLRGFKRPKAIGTDTDMYYHNSTKFTSSTVLIVCSTLIEHIVRQALTLSLLGASENFYKGWADLTVSGYLDGVV
jgi:phage major head subunit gpT-like protein